MTTYIDAQDSLGRLCPAELSRLITIFENEGEHAYLVGGCVRDALMQKTPHDWDVAVTTPPEHTVAICERHQLRCIPTGIAHGTVTVLLSDKTPVEATTCRTEGGYSDSRHPDSVSFTDRIENDLCRRDFTVNAMAATLDPSTGGFKIIDLFGGIDDLNAGIIRCVGDPETRFTEDALRILRAVRFASRFDFSIEPATEAAIKITSSGLSNISRERISSELEQILTSDSADRGIKALRDLGLLPHFARASNGGLITDSLRVSTLPRSYPVRLAAFLYLLGLPESELAPTLKELKLPTATVKECLTYLEADVSPEPTPLGARRLRRDFGTHAENLLSFMAALGINGMTSERARELSELIKASEEMGDCVTLRELAIDGKRLSELGIPRGKITGKILEALLDTVISDPALNRDDILCELGVKIYKNSPQNA